MKTRNVHTAAIVSDNSRYSFSVIVIAITLGLLSLFAENVRADSEPVIKVVSIEAAVKDGVVNVAVDYRVTVEGSLDAVHSRVIFYAKKDGEKEKIIGSDSDLGWSEDHSEAKLEGVTLEAGKYSISAVVESGDEWVISGSTQVVVK